MRWLLLPLLSLVLAGCSRALPRDPVPEEKKEGEEKDASVRLVKDHLRRIAVRPASVEFVQVGPNISRECVEELRKAEAERVARKVNAWPDTRLQEWDEAVRVRFRVTGNLQSLRGCWWGSVTADQWRLLDGIFYIQQGRVVREAENNSGDDWIGSPYWR